MQFAGSHMPRFATAALSHNPFLAQLLRHKITYKHVQTQASIKHHGLQHLKHRFTVRRLTSPTIAAAAAAPTVVQAGVNAWHVLQHSIASSPGHFLMGVAAIVAGCAFAVFVVAALPSLVAFHRAATALEALSRALETEVPDTAAALRLSGFELSDCLEEFAQLSTDLTQGVRASARVVATAEQGFREGTAAAAGLVTDTIVPHVVRNVPKAAAALEVVLQRNASILDDASASVQLAAAAKVTARRMRGLLAAAQVTSRIASLTGRRRGQLTQTQAHPRLQ